MQSIGFRYITESITKHYLMSICFIPPKETNMKTKIVIVQGWVSNTGQINELIKS